MKTLEELLGAGDPAWPMIQGWMREAACPVEALAPSEPARGEELVGLQMTTRSPLGAVLYESGGLLVDYGWVRVLGSGHPRLGRSLLSWNRSRAWPDPAVRPPYLLVADDVVGGLFAIDWGGLGFEFNTLAYFAPDTLRWEGLDMGYSDWLSWLMSGRLAEFYGDFRWKGWEPEVAALAGARGFMILPPAFLKGKPFAERERDAVPMTELYGISRDFADQLKDVPDGTVVELKVRKPEER